MEKEPFVLCRRCRQPATVHLMENDQGKQKEAHFCEACAEKLGLLKHQQLDIKALLRLK